MTDKQLEIVRLVVINFKYQEIMDLLGVSRRDIQDAFAVAKHEYGVYRKSALWVALHKAGKV